MTKYDVTFDYLVPEYHTVYAVEADNEDDAADIAIELAKEDLNGVPFEELTVNEIKETSVNG